jgi:hypothetical protein
MAKGPVYQKSFAFAVRVIKLARFLQTEKREFVKTSKESLNTDKSETLCS